VNKTSAKVTARLHCRVLTFSEHNVNTFLYFGYFKPRQTPRMHPWQTNLWEVRDQQTAVLYGIRKQAGPSNIKLLIAPIATIFIYFILSLNFQLPNNIPYPLVSLSWPLSFCLSETQ